jgi:UDP-3-O-[3-hydroxymyristoyl] glucosamine N-acyltransferase
MRKEILLTDIINFIKDKLKVIHGNPEGIKVKYLRAPKDVDQITLDWINDGKENIQDRVETSKAMAIIIAWNIVYSESLKNQGKVIIQVENPKLEIARIANEFFVEKKFHGIHHTAVIHPNAVMGENIYIGPNSIIGDCKIGNNVIIFGNVFIYDNVEIHDDVEIHNGVSLGNEATNFIRDIDGQYIRFAHIGKVVIENNVVIGANSVISRGVLENTIIKKGSKIAQLVFIGANNIIGENCLIRPNVMTSGSVSIGAQTIIAPSVTIREHRKVGEGCFIGMGAVVTKDIPNGETWIGNPAKKMVK